MAKAWAGIRMVFVPIVHLCLHRSRMGQAVLNLAAGHTVTGSIMMQGTGNADKEYCYFCPDGCDNHILCFCCVVGC